MDNVSNRRADYHAYAFGDVVDHAEEIGGEVFAERVRLAVLNYLECGFWRVGKIFLALHYDFFRKEGRINRGIADLIEEVGYGADVIIVAMSDYHRFDIGFLRF